MTSIPGNANIPGGGQRRQRAAQLRAEMEASQGEQRMPADIDGQQRESASDQEQGQADGTGPVGRGDYVVKQGDCMASIAVGTGHFWETIWDDPANAELKEVRKDPYVLFPGDRVTIPEIRPKEEAGDTEQRHRFVRRGVPETLVIHFRIDGEPRANQAYVVVIDGESSEGVTDPNGRVEVFVPPGAKSGKIRFRERGDEYELDLGELDPIAEVSGVQKRLRNLGLYHGAVDGEMNDWLEQAIRDFRERAGIEPTGNLDQETRDAIQQAHGA